MQTARMMTIECTVIVFEGADMIGTISSIQRAMNLKEQILSLMVQLLAIDYPTVIVGGWFQTQFFDNG